MSASTYNLLCVVGARPNFIKMAALSTNTLHSIADTTHAGVLEDRGGAEQSTAGIAAAVQAVRANAPVSAE